MRKRIDDNYYINDDKKELQLDVIHQYLSEESYWAQKIPIEVVAKSIEHSKSIGVFYKKEQIGFARVLTDYATFAYIGDVFILENHRKKGLSKALVRYILDHPELQGLRRWILMTHDAHGLYEQFDFKVVEKPSRVMEITYPNIYLKKE